MLHREECIMDQLCYGAKIRGLADEGSSRIIKLFQQDPVSEMKFFSAMAEVESFLLKFQTLWRNGRDATLTVDSCAGQTRVRLKVGLVICLPSAWGKAWLFRKRMGGIPFSLKLEGQDWQCIFHAFSLGVGRQGFSCPLGRCGKAWLFLYLTLLSIYNGGLTLSR